MKQILQLKRQLSSKVKKVYTSYAMIDYRRIRATYDDETITVYQAYNRSIAEAAVKHQKLSASSSFKPGRMTWIKPSFCWMMYRCGYSYKDKNQERVLALRMKHEHFKLLMSEACLAKEKHARDSSVIVQWDPERGPALQKYDFRSIQIGIPGSIVGKWIDEWIASIEDVTDMARDLKKRVDEDGTIESEQLVEEGLLPLERQYEMPEDISKRLRIGEDLESE